MPEFKTWDEARQKEALEAAKAADAQTDLNKSVAKYLELVSQFAKPSGVEDFAAELELANRALSEGLIDLEQYAHWLERIKGQKSIDPEIIKMPEETPFQKWVADAQNSGKKMQDVWVSALGGVTDNMTEFFTGRRADWRSFLVDILKMIVRIQAAKFAAGIITSATGGAPAGWGTNANISNNLFADGGAFDGGVQFFANGGAFTNKIVNRPTKFAHGGGLGVMGEAGPEAIMPLARASNGKLGVMAIGGGGVGGMQVNITINQGGGVEADTAGDTEMARRLAAALPAMVENWYVKNVARPGGTYHKG